MTKSGDVVWDVWLKIVGENMKLHIQMFFFLKSFECFCVLWLLISVSLLIL